MRNITNFCSYNNSNIVNTLVTFKEKDVDATCGGITTFIRSSLLLSSRYTVYTLVTVIIKPSGGNANKAQVLVALTAMFA